MISSKVVTAILAVWSTSNNFLVQGLEVGSPRIIGGNGANRNTSPNSIVIIVDRTQELVCGGTLISPTLVMTAAHCARGILSFAHVGRYNRNDPSEQFDSIPIIAERIHPGYDSQRLEHDIMLLQLERPTTIDVDYMMVNNANNMPPVGARLTALGWGVTEPNSDNLEGTAILQQVELSYVSNQECDSKKNQEQDYQGKITETMLCTLSEGADHCYGDSGGPIVAISSTDPTVVMQVAIISWGADECADGFFPGVGQRTSTSYQWIADWVCAIDGTDETMKGRYSCQDGQTFSPGPTPAPAAPTISPAPTLNTVDVWVELFMDEWPEDIRWVILEKNSSVPVNSSPSYAGNTDDVIIEKVALDPNKAYEFVISDEFGDGIKNGGSYQVRLGGDFETAAVLFTSNFEGARASHTFSTPDRTPAPVVPSSLPTKQPSTMSPTTRPTASPPSNPTAKPSSPGAESPLVPDATCLAIGDECSDFSECCSQRCNLGACQKAAATSETRTGSNNNKIPVDENHGGGAARMSSNKVVMTDKRAGNARQLRRNPRAEPR